MNRIEFDGLLERVRQSDNATLVSLADAYVSGKDIEGLTEDQWDELHDLVSDELRDRANYGFQF